MRITFVVPMLNLTGGLRVVSVYAERLAKNGHTVTVISPGGKKPNIVQRIKSIIRWKGYVFKTGFDTSFFRNSSYTLIVLDKCRAITNDDVPDADVVIATFWLTAEWIYTFSETKGKKVYFIQGYETHSWLPIDRVKATYRLPYKQIAVAQWITTIMQTEYQNKSTVTIANAVDHEFFNAAIRQKNMQITFGMIYSSRPIKGSQFAFRCFNEFRKINPKVQLTVFGMDSLDEVNNLPNGAQYYSCPEQDKISEIYSECDVWLFTSSSEGFGLPILEAMACRTPVIGTCCGAAPDLLASGGGILIDVDDRKALLRAMTKIYEMGGGEWELMSDKAYKEAVSHQWKDKVTQFENALSCN